MGQDFVRDAPGTFNKLSDMSLSSELLQRRDTGDGLERMLTSSIGGGRILVDTLHSTNASGGAEQRGSLQRESLCFMKGVMDECTHIANFSGKEII